MSALNTRSSVRGSGSAEASAHKAAVEPAGHSSSSSLSDGVESGRDSASQVTALSKEVARLEQQLQEFRQLSSSSSAAAAEQQQQQQQQQQPKQSKHQHSRFSQESQSQQQQQQQQHVRVAAVQPPELTYAGATAGTALDDWLFKLGQLFAQTRMPETAWEERLQTAWLYWDRNMSLWWNGCQEAAEVAHAPILTWAAFVSALRKQFVPAGDSHLARTELFKLRMRSSEGMEAYMQRAVLLVPRAGSLVDSKTGAALALEGVDKSRFPFTCAAVARKEREAVGGLVFAQMRQELTTEATQEPQLGRGGGGGGGGSSSSSSGSSNSSSNSSSRGRTNKGSSSKQMRISALQQQLAALEEADDDDYDSNSYSAAPLATAASGSEVRCFKCGLAGHISSECKSKKELRSCFRCKEVGHVRSSCPQRSTKPRVEGEGSKASAAAPSASSRPASKNE